MAPLARVERAEWRRPKSARGGEPLIDGVAREPPLLTQYVAARCTEQVDDEDPMRL